MRRTRVRIPFSTLGCTHPSTGDTPCECTTNAPVATGVVAWNHSAEEVEIPSLGVGRPLKEGDSDGRNIPLGCRTAGASRRRARILHCFDVRGVFFLNLWKRPR